MSSVVSIDRSIVNRDDALDARSDVDRLIAQLRRAVIANDVSLPSPSAVTTPVVRELGAAINELIHAAVEREREARAVDEDVLLALEELARDQAADLARQNEELRRAKAALEEKNAMLERQNAELIRAGRMKDEFLATMSHELRTPLTSIIGYSEILLERIAGPLTDEQHGYVGDVLRSGRHLLGLINDLLDLAKMDAGRMEFQRAPVELGIVAAEAADIVRSMALRKRQTLDVQIDVQTRCLGDAQRIRQIALNLLSNAVKFTPAGGAIELSVRHREEFCELVVRDEGIGIDPANHGLIFEAFRQVDGSQTREHQGTGLGLTLVKKFCEAQGGSISVESELGKGATFTVRLPRAEPLPVGRAHEGLR